jgi:hypothetical protein
VGVGGLREDRGQRITHSTEERTEDRAQSLEHNPVGATVGAAGGAGGVPMCVVARGHTVASARVPAVADR